MTELQLLEELKKIDTPTITNVVATYPDHELCLGLFEGLLESAPTALEADAKYYLDFAVRHKAIVERFGRYPHRNEILGRASSDEEAKFLQEPGSAF